MNNNITFKIDSRLEILWEYIGLSKEKRSNEIKRLSETLINAYENFIKAVNSECQKLRDEIEVLNKNFNEIKLIYGEKDQILPNISSLSLLKQKEIYIKAINDLKEKYQPRIKEFEDVQSQIIKLYQILGIYREDKIFINSQNSQIHKENIEINIINKESKEMVFDNKNKSPKIINNAQNEIIENQINEIIEFDEDQDIVKLKTSILSHNKMSTEHFESPKFIKIKPTLTIKRNEKAQNINEAATKEENASILEKLIKTNESRENIHENHIKIKEDKVNLHENHIKSNEKETNLHENHIKSNEKETNLHDNHIKTKEEKANLHDNHIKSNENETNLHENHIKTKEEKIKLSENPINVTEDDTNSNSTRQSDNSSKANEVHKTGNENESAETGNDVFDIYEDSNKYFAFDINNENDLSEERLIHFKDRLKLLKKEKNRRDSIINTFRNSIYQLSDELKEKVPQAISEILENGYCDKKSLSSLEMHTIYLTELKENRYELISEKNKKIDFLYYLLAVDSEDQIERSKDPTKESIDDLDKEIEFLEKQKKRRLPIVIQKLKEAIQILCTNLNITQKNRPNYKNFASNKGKDTMSSLENIAIFLNIEYKRLSKIQKKYENILETIHEREELIRLIKKASTRKNSQSPTSTSQKVVTSLFSQKVHSPSQKKNFTSPVKKKLNASAPSRASSTSPSPKASLSLSSQNLSDVTSPSNESPSQKSSLLLPSEKISQLSLSMVAKSHIDGSTVLKIEAIDDHLFKINKKLIKLLRDYKKESGQDFVYEGVRVIKSIEIDMN